MSSEAPLGKALAANDKKTRDKAVKSLRTFLSCGQPLDIDVSAEEASNAQTTEADWAQGVKLEARFSPLELQKLWKALFYCMWMSDKPLVQQKLADDLADLVLVVRSSKTPSRIGRVNASLAFLEAFWAIVLREWSGLDRLRMDKYYRLLRRYLVASFKMLAREQWDRHAVHRFNAIMASGPLNSSDPKLLLSVLSHVAEIYPASLAEAVVPDAPLSSSTELDAIPAPSTSKPRTAPLPILDLMQPAIQSLCQATQKSHFAAVFDHLLEPLLLACDNIAPPSQKNKRRKLDDDDAHFAQVLQQSPLCDTEGAPLAPEDVESKLLSVIFEAASQPTVSVANRRRLYALCRERMPDEEAPAEEA